ncbi:MAG: porin family protein [Pseudomonadota bacterium]
MKHFLDKTRLFIRVAVGSLVIVMAMVAPPASAQDARTQALERALKQMESQLQALRSELNQVKSESAREAQKVMAIEEKTIQIEEKASHAKEYTRTAQEKAEHAIEMADIMDKRLDRKSHMLFFRGGFAHANDPRNGVSINSAGLGGAGGVADKDAWYIGAGFDWNLTKDAWGLAPRTSVASELMFEYKEFGSNVRANGLPAAGAGVNVSQLTLTAAPKIKFFEGSRLRPWIIPAGLGIHVISPPSESITVLIPGVMFGAGVDYRIWKSFFVGLDARYHLTSGRNDGIRIDGVTAGGYLGIGF